MQGRQPPLLKVLRGWIHVCWKVVALHQLESTGCSPKRGRPLLPHISLALAASVFCQRQKLSDLMHTIIWLIIVGLAAVFGALCAHASQRQQRRAPNSFEGGGFAERGGSDGGREDDSRARRRSLGIMRNGGSEAAGNQQRPYATHRSR